LASGGETILPAGIFVFDSSTQFQPERAAWVISREPFRFTSEVGKSLWETRLKWSKRTRMNIRRLIVMVLVAASCLWLASKAGSFLVLNKPGPSDVIVVLAGETDRRPQRALELLAQGYARRVVLDVPNRARVFGSTEIELAEKYVQNLPQASSITVCPIDGLSTKAESKEAARCLAHQPGKRVLIVTSDFHTRRALEIFRHELPGDEYSVAAVYDGAAFGVRWWTHREWAKTFMGEWLKVIWWKMVDQWR
jgi:uncharacterized SAM-binding protein YcdF (DUF218 family)